MGNYELWVKGCEKTGTDIYPLEKSKRPNSGMYMTKREYMMEYRVYYETPVYHVWADDKWIAATTDYQAAYRIFTESEEAARCRL